MSILKRLKDDLEEAEMKTEEAYVLLVMLVGDLKEQIEDKKTYEQFRTQIHNIMGLLK